MENKLKIRKTKTVDEIDILNIISSSFSGDEEVNAIKGLVKNLLNDSTAQPSLSLLAFEGDKPAGYILFSKTSLEKNKDKISTAILCPLAVISESQNKGVGGELITTGLKTLEESGVNIVFVLGYPEYYTRYGFSPAGSQGMEAPFPIPEKNSDAWMLKTLGGYVIEGYADKVNCPDALNKSEYWVE